jgi:hypothetical protein
MAVDEDSAIPAAPIPPTPPVTPVTQTTTMDSPFNVVAVEKLTGKNMLKTKGKSGDTKKPKRKRVALDSDDEVCIFNFKEEVKKIVLILLTCMVKHGGPLTFDEAVLKCGFSSMIGTSSR